MSEMKELNRAVNSFSKNIADFPVGAISLNDLKPTEEKIQDLRNSLKALNARLLMLKSKIDAEKLPTVSKESIEVTFDNLQDEITSSIINEKGISSCLQSRAIKDIFNKHDMPEMQAELKGIMQKLYTLNDFVIGLNQERSELLDKETTLIKELQEDLLNFSDFLKEQEDIRTKKLQETNPEIASSKDKMQKRLQRINIMKRLITNFIGSSAHLIKFDPLLDEMMRNHRELIDIETIINMSTEPRTDEY